MNGTKMFDLSLTFILRALASFGVVLLLTDLWRRWVSSSAEVSSRPEFAARAGRLRIGGRLGELSLGELLFLLAVWSVGFLALLALGPVQRKTCFSVWLFPSCCLISDQLAEQQLGGSAREARVSNGLDRGLTGDCGYVRRGIVGRRSAKRVRPTASKPISSRRRSSRERLAVLWWIQPSAVNRTRGNMLEEQTGRMRAES